MSFKAGTYKGMDLTFGDNSNSHGGILIRAIMNISTKKYIEGPCNTVTEILKSQGAKECKELELLSWPKHDGDAFDTTHFIHLVPCDPSNLKIEKSPRVGLTLKRYDLLKEKYWMSDYRYLSYPHLCKKQNALI